MAIVGTGSASIAVVIDGETSYTWIMYADDNKGNGMTSNPDGKDYIGFSYNRLSKAPSDRPTDYEWSRVKGETGVGIVSSIVEYQVSNSGSITPTEAWSVEIPEIVAGMYMWTRVTTKYSDGKETTAYSVVYTPTGGLDGSTIISDNKSPENPVANQVWNDTSATPSVLKMWDADRKTWVVYLWSAHNIQANSIGVDKLAADVINANDIVTEGLKSTNATVEKTLTIGTNGTIKTSFNTSKEMVSTEKDAPFKYKAQGALTVEKGSVTTTAKVQGVGGNKNGKFIGALDGSVPGTYDATTILSDNQLFFQASNLKEYVVSQTGVNGSWVAATALTSGTDRQVAISPLAITIGSMEEGKSALAPKEWQGTVITKSGINTPHINTTKNFSNTQTSIITNRFMGDMAHIGKEIHVSNNPSIPGSGKSNIYDLTFSGSNITPKAGTRIRLYGDYVHIPSAYTKTASGGANVIVAKDGALVRSTSARKYKTNIRHDITIKDSNKLLEVPLSTWDDKAELKRTGKSDRYFGMIAEDLADAGLDYLVTRDEDGEIEGIEYARVSLLLIPLVKSLQETVAKQQEQIDNLSGKVSTLRRRERNKRLWD